MFTQSHVHKVPSCMHGHGCTVSMWYFPQNRFKGGYSSQNLRYFWIMILNISLYSVFCIWKNANFDWRNKQPSRTISYPWHPLSLRSISLSHYPLLAQWPYHVLIDTLEMTAQCTILYQFYTFWIHYSCIFPTMFPYIDIW